MEYTDILSEVKNKKITIDLPSNLWHKIDGNVLYTVQKGKWNTFKFYTKDHSRNSKINDINNKVGGIYLFYVTPDIIPHNHKIIMYIGRALYSDSQNLRKRVSEYYGYASNYRRPKISNMLNEWWEDIYCSYLELQCTNKEIEHIEAELINNLLPFRNDLIPNKTISSAVKAAGLQ